MTMGQEQLAESWRKDFEKYILSRKLALAHQMLGDAAGNPTIENVKSAFSRIFDYVSNLPAPPGEAKDERDKLIQQIREVQLLLFGNPELIKVKKLYVKHRVKPVMVRSGVKMVPSISDIPKVVLILQDIITSAGDYAYARGLRLQRPIRKTGMDKIEDEEGFDTEDHTIDELVG